MRGNVEEGRETHAHGTFVNGFHEVWPIRHAEEAFGFARVGQTIVNVPDNKTMKLYVDDEPMLLSVADLEAVRPDAGLPGRIAAAGHHLAHARRANGSRSSPRRMVSFTQRHLAIMTIEVTMLDEDAPVVVSSQTLNRQDGRDEYHVRAAAMGSGVDPRKAESFESRVLEPQSHWCGDGRIILGYRCYNSKMTLAVGVDHTIETDNSYQELISADEDTGKMVYRVDAKAGRADQDHQEWLRTTPRVAYPCANWSTAAGGPWIAPPSRASSSSSPISVPGWTGTGRAPTSRSSVSRRCSRPFAGTSSSWPRPPPRAEQSGVPAKGVTGSGYGGHYFWDTEIYVLPFLSYTSPKMARSALRFRYNMLDAARRRAQDLAQSGALFPWRTINGEEASAYYAAGTAQYHIDADIAFALCKYVSASGDDEFMLREGVDILVETARMWADLGFWREPSPLDGMVRTFHIHGVTGPDEYTTVVNDNLFTNVMARFNLAMAAEVVQQHAERPDDGRSTRWSSGWGSRTSEVDDWAEAAAEHGHPVRSDHRHQPAGLPLPGPGGLGPEEHPGGQAAPAAALPPAGDLPLPGAQAGGRGAGAVPAG